MKSTHTFFINYQTAGDILLVRNKAATGTLNVFGQSAGTLRVAKYSHAILCLNIGVFADSMKISTKSDENGVRLFCADQLRKDLNKKYSKNWKVIRHTNLTQDDKIKIIGKAGYYYRQGYNKKVFSRFFKKQYSPDASFCSELIDRIFRDIGITIKKRDVWPVHLARLPKIRPQTWKDVTDEYKTEVEWPDGLNESYWLNACKGQIDNSKLLFDGGKVLQEIDRQLDDFYANHYEMYLNAAALNAQKESAESGSEKRSYKQSRVSLLELGVEFIDNEKKLDRNIELLREINWNNLKFKKSTAGQKELYFLRFAIRKVNQHDLDQLVPLSSDCLSYFELVAKDDIDFSRLEDIAKKLSELELIEYSDADMEESLLSLKELIKACSDEGLRIEIRLALIVISHYKLVKACINAGHMDLDLVQNKNIAEMVKRSKNALKNRAIRSFLSGIECGE